MSVPVPRIVGKQRPRMGRNGSVYTPRRTLDAEARIRAAWNGKVGDRWAGFVGEVHMRVSFTRQLARSNPKSWEGRADLGHIDLDNMLKTVLDALNGLAYKDDSQVTRIEAEKAPRVPHGRGDRIDVVCIYYEEK